MLYVVFILMISITLLSFLRSFIFMKLEQIMRDEGETLPPIKFYFDYNKFKKILLKNSGNEEKRIFYLKIYKKLILFNRLILFSFLLLILFFTIFLINIL